MVIRYAKTGISPNGISPNGKAKLGITQNGTFLISGITEMGLAEEAIDRILCGGFSPLLVLDHLLRLNPQTYHIIAIQTLAYFLQVSNQHSAIQQT